MMAQWGRKTGGAHPNTDVPDQHPALRDDYLHRPDNGERGSERAVEGQWKGSGKAMEGQRKGSEGQWKGSGRQWKGSGRQWTDSEKATKGQRKGSERAVEGQRKDSGKDSEMDSERLCLTCTGGATARRASSTSAVKPLSYLPDTAKSRCVPGHLQAVEGCERQWNVKERAVTVEGSERTAKGQQQ